MIRFLCRLAAVFCLSVAALAAPTPFTAKLMAGLDRIEDPRLSPDGRLVLYGLRTVDFAAGKASHALWLVDVKTHAARRLAISEGGATSGRWAPDATIYFLSDRDGGLTQVFRTTVAGRDAQPVTKLPLAVNAFRLSPEAKTLVVSVAEYPDCPDMACTRTRLDAAQAGKPSGRVYDRLFVRHWDQWADGTRNHLYALPLDLAGHGGAAVALTKGFDGDVPSKPFGDDGDFTISPDGRTVVFSAKSAGKTEAWTTNFDDWSVPIDAAAAPRNLTAANPAWDGAPVFSPDGHWSAWRAMKRPGFEADRFAIFLRNQASGEVRELAPDWDRSPQALAWSADGKTLIASAEDVGEARLFAIDIATGAVHALTGEGHVTGFDVGAKAIVYSSDSLTGPAQLYLLDASGKPVRLTDANAQALQDVVWGQAERFAFKGWNDETVHAIVIKPAGFERGRKYPVAFLIHGGPQGSFGNAWSYRWNPQVYANAGYGVVMIDFHGSTGYGQAFTDSISRHWGDRPLEDLQKGWAYALSRYPFLDANRACALGASYGGYMIAWIAGVWNEPWKCLVDHDGVFDTRGMGYATEELWFDEWERGGPFFAVPEAYEAFNPAAHVKAWKKPMLVIHGGNDFRIPLAQGLGAFTALQRQGIESRLLYFPDENHWVLKPQNSVQWHAEVLGWLDRWTKP
jgi:dipeptidyl aminopeptidase/acylaminoacyl peptidase